jgi:hypothetical protein
LASGQPSRRDERGIRLGVEGQRVEVPKTASSAAPNTRPGRSRRHLSAATPVIEPVRIAQLRGRAPEERLKLRFPL